MEDEFVDGFIVACGVVGGGFEGVAGGLDFEGVHPPEGGGEGFEGAAMDGAPVGEEDVGDVSGLDAGAFEEALFEGVCGERGIDEDV